MIWNGVLESPSDGGVGIGGLSYAGASDLKQEVGDDH